MGIFSVPPDLPVTKNKEEIDKTYRYWRLHLMITSYIGYAVFYFTRKSFNFVMPAMLTDLGLQKADIGIMGTAFYLTYGVSKFLSGVLGDRSNPRYFMGIGLMMTGIVNILFGMSSSVFMFITLWMINAFFQGWGWPPCSKILNTWYSRNERGLWWAIWNTSHNLGGALIPILSGAVALYWGWRYGMIVPGIIACVIGFALCFLLRDRPTSMGLPTVGEWRNDIAEKEHESEGLGLSNWEINKEIGVGIVTNAGDLRNSDVSIGGTSWKPEIPIYEKIESEIQAIMNADLSVTERAITIMLYIMRSQMFFDGNKRTAQLAANQIMIQGGAGVLRIPVECQKEFFAKLIGYYETGNMREVKRFVYDTSIDGFVKKQIEQPEISAEMFRKAVQEKRFRK